MRHFTFVPLMIWMMCSSGHAAGEVCSRNPSDLKWIPAIKDDLVDEATKDLPQFCQWNRLDRLVKSYPPEVQKQYQQLKNKNDLNAVGDLLSEKGKDVSFDPWTLSMAGHPKVKNLAHGVSYLVSCPESTAVSCPPAKNSEIEEAIQNPFKNPTLQIPDFKPFESAKSTAPQRAAACTIFSDSSWTECNKNLSKLESFMQIESFQMDQVMIAPYREGAKNVYAGGSQGFAMGVPMASSMVTAAPVIKKILTDKSATEGLRKTAIKLLAQQKT